LGSFQASKLLLASMINLGCQTGSTIGVEKETSITNDTRCASDQERPAIGHARPRVALWSVRAQLFLLLAQSGTFEMAASRPLWANSDHREM
jgi:hypothetical protein